MARSQVFSRLLTVHTHKENRRAALLTTTHTTTTTCMSCEHIAFYTTPRQTPPLEWSPMPLLQRICHSNPLYHRQLWLSASTLSNLNIRISSLGPEKKQVSELVEVFNRRFWLCPKDLRQGPRLRAVRGQQQNPSAISNSHSSCVHVAETSLHVIISNVHAYSFPTAI